MGHLYQRIYPPPLGQIRYKGISGILPRLSWLTLAEGLGYPQLPMSSLYLGILYTAPSTRSLLAALYNSCLSPQHRPRNSSEYPSVHTFEDASSSLSFSSCGGSASSTLRTRLLHIFPHSLFQDRNTQIARHRQIPEASGSTCIQSRELSHNPREDSRCSRYPMVYQQPIRQVRNYPVHRPPRSRHQQLSYPSATKHRCGAQGCG